ncbi:MAG: thiol reductant ABC exporter subunit CydD [Thermaerobacter sp.]|nr:thiol reductant ABC exporter subunit CydD [Thermaerobacter sp.]
MFPRLLREVAPLRHLVIAVGALGVVTGVLIVTEASIIARIVAAVYFHHVNPSTWTIWLAFLLGVVVTRAATAGVAETLALNLATVIQAQLRQSLLKRLFDAGPLAWKQDQAGQLINTVIAGIDNLESFLARYLPQVALTAVVPVMIGIRVACSDWISAGILLITVPLIPLFMVLIGRYAQDETQLRWAKLGRLGAHFLDLVQGLPTLKLFGQSWRQASALSASAEEFRRSTMASLRWAFLSGMVLELLASLSMAMIAVAVGLRLVSGDISFERAMLLLILIPDFYGPWRALGAKFHEALNGLSASRTIYDWLDRPVLSRRSAGDGLSGRGPWPLVLTAVGFTYPSMSRPALKDVQFALPPHSSLAVIGPSGSGKSTLLALVLGFADPTHGSITVDSRPLATLGRGWWWTQVAYVDQSPYLFSGTIRDNLRMANRTAGEDQLAQALQKAQLEETLHRFPDGLDTVVGENGVRLSGGERQRLALARAFLQAKPFVIMDEPSAHLDARTEYALLQGIVELKRHATVIWVTHHAATLEAADQVAILTQGRIAEWGPLAELRHPFYRQTSAEEILLERQISDAVLARTLNSL